jgi:hypothetical protein
LFSGSLTCSSAASHSQSTYGITGEAMKTQGMSRGNGELKEKWKEESDMDAVGL